MTKFMTALNSRDIKFLYAVNHGIKCRFLDIFMPYITQLGSAVFTITLPFTMIIFKRNGLKVSSIEILIALSGSHIIAYIIKRTVNRPRPSIALDNINTYGIELYNYSFPSGHTTAAFSTAVVLSLNFPQLSIVFIPLAFMVGISRMYLGVHYPTDVFIGSIIGTVFAVGTHICI